MKLTRKTTAPLITDNFGNQYPDAVIHSIKTEVEHGISLKVTFGMFKDEASFLANSKPLKIGNFFFTPNNTDPAEIDTIFNITDIKFADFLLLTTAAENWVLAQFDWDGLPFDDNWDLDNA